jgi:hypothetical protein
MELVGITHAIIVEALSIDEGSRTVEGALKKNLHGASMHPVPPLTSDAHYDAACAHSLLAKRADDEDTKREQIDLSIDHLKIAFSATPPAQQARFTSMAQTDPTLAAVRTYARLPQDPAKPTYDKFDDAVGVAPSAAPTQDSVELSFADGQKLTLQLEPAGN